MKADTLRTMPVAIAHREGAQWVRDMAGAAVQFPAGNR